MIPHQRKQTEMPYFAADQRGNERGPALGKALMSSFTPP